MHGKDYEAPVMRYTAWGDTADAEQQHPSPKSVTTGWVAGPAIPIFRATEYVQFLAECVSKGGTGTLYYKLEISDTATATGWGPLCAGTAMTRVGNEMHSELLPFVRHYPALDNDIRGFTFTFKSRYIRLLVKGDVAGASLRVMASM